MAVVIRQRRAPASLLLRLGTQGAGAARSARRVAALGSRAIRLRMETSRVPAPASSAELVARARTLSQLCGELARVHGLSISSYGQRPQPGAILVANHVSYLDPLVLGSLCPFVPITKSEVSRWPVIGPALRSLGALYVDRDSLRSGGRVLRGAQAALDAGVSVLCFPEGTTTDGTTLLTFKRGIFGLAEHAHVPVVPVAIRYETPAAAWHGDMTFVPHYLRMASRARTRVNVHFGSPIWPLPGRGHEDIRQSAWESIARLLTP